MRDAEEPYLRLWSPMQMLSGAQWPMEDALRGFRTVFEQYLPQVEALSFESVDLLAEALGLVSGALTQCFQDPSPPCPTPRPRCGWLQHRAKVVKYLLAAAACTRASRTRPLFQNIAWDLLSVTLVPSAPEEILKLKNERGTLAATDSVNYTGYSELPSGLVNLIGHVKSHPDVAEEHYSDLFKQFLPDGMLLQGCAYSAGHQCAYNLIRVIEEAGKNARRLRKALATSHEENSVPNEK
ncbi:hypothetical protein OBBRIDRAFT_828205 [Obba rivulosa]|uniref:Uncharacterized protein n=1 Tax=Obba rivulosa TaxID=1052685 RepID=A0A8E2ATY8_9APHY|nr:hypothetical protein OBBRIDRAFT_828205 [Obba rivulosa]